MGYVKTEGQNTEIELKRLNKTLQTLSNSNRAMRYAQDEIEYLEEVCKIIIEDCGHAMVWVGLAEDEENKKVIPVAYSGFDQGYIKTLDITWAGNKHSREPTGTAIHDGKICSCKNMQIDPNFEPWREEALKRGYASILALPLMNKDKSFGAVTIYSSEPDPFSDDEIKLLADLADDISYGIITLRLSTAKSKVEDALLTSEARFDEVLDNFTDAFLILDSKWRYVYVNAAAEKFANLSREEMLGEVICNVLPNFVNSIPYKQCKKTMKDKIPRTWTTKAVIGDIWSEFRAYPWKNGFSLFIRDISKRKNTEKALRESEVNALTNLENLEKVLDAVPAAVWIANDPKAIHISGNKLAYDWLNLPLGSEISKSAPEEDQPDTFKMFKDGTDLKPEEMPIQMSARGEEINNFEFSFVYPDGSQRQMLGNATPLLDENGKPRGSVSSFIDITERKLSDEKLKKTMDELSRSNQELEHFAHVASHDLREPLRMITSFLQLLEKRYKDQLDQNANEFIGFAVDGAKRLNNMIKDLLEYSQVMKKEREFNPVKLDKVLEETLINLVVQTEENNVTITYDPLPNIMGDEKLLVYLFQNLIGNAIKYRSQETPQIHISAIKQKDHFLLSVKDNGIGIDSEHLNRIFTIFQRLHGNEEYEGTGIGLAIAQKIVHLHGGRIWAESELGKGSTFYFTIPKIEY